MPSKQDKALFGLLNSTPSSRDLLANLGTFAGLGAGRNAAPRMSNQQNLVDPLTLPVTSAPSSSGGATTQDLLEQLAAQTQVLNGLVSANSDNSELTSVLKTLTGFLGGGSSGGSLGGILGGILGGGLGIPSLIGGLMDLFGGGSSGPPPLVPFQMPSSVQFQGGIDGGGTSGISAVDYSANGLPRSAGQASSQASGHQITVQVNAMDSKSFLDHSDDIARAVRQAMLESNSLNDVVAGI